MANGIFGITPFESAIPKEEKIFQGLFPFARMNFDQSSMKYNQLIVGLRETACYRPNPIFSLIPCFSNASEWLGTPLHVKQLLTPT